MKPFSRAVLIAALSLFATLASAATGVANISFSPPTTNTDGSAIVSSDILQHDVECKFTPTGSTTATTCVTTPAFLQGGASTNGTVTFTYDPKGGQVCFKLRTQTIIGLSLFSSPAACRALAAVTPNPPGNVVITVTISAP